MTEQNPTKQSAIMIQFSEPGSVVFNATFDGVTPMQILAIASWLELKAKNALIQAENQRAEEEAQRAIARPKLVMPGSMQ